MWENYTFRTKLQYHILTLSCERVPMQRYALHLHLQMRIGQNADALRQFTYLRHYNENAQSCVYYKYLQTYKLPISATKVFCLLLIHCAMYCNTLNLRGPGALCIYHVSDYR